MDSKILCTSWANSKVAHSSKHGKVKFFNGVTLDFAHNNFAE